MVSMWQYQTYPICCCSKIVVKCSKFVVNTVLVFWSILQYFGIGQLWNDIFMGHMGYSKLRQQDPTKQQPVWRLWVAWHHDKDPRRENIEVQWPHLVPSAVGWCRRRPSAKFYHGGEATLFNPARGAAKFNNHADCGIRGAKQENVSILTVELYSPFWQSIAYGENCDVQMGRHYPVDYKGLKVKIRTCLFG